MCPCSAVKAAAKAAGAFGCTISGAGPTCVAVTNNRATGEAAAAAMAAAFKQDGGLEVMTLQDRHTTFPPLYRLVASPLLPVLRCSSRMNAMLFAQLCSSCLRKLNTCLLHGFIMYSETLGVASAGELLNCCHGGCAWGLCNRIT